MIISSSSHETYVAGILHTQAEILAAVQHPIALPDILKRDTRKFAPELIRNDLLLSLRSHNEEFVLPLPVNLGDPDAAVAAVFVVHRQNVVRPRLLHPLGHSDPGLIFADVGDSEVA